MLLRKSCEPSETIERIQKILNKLDISVIEKNIITYEDLYKYDEEELWHIIKTSKDKKIQEWVKKFETIKTIPDLNYP